MEDRYRNVNYALPGIVDYMRTWGVVETSRNGGVLSLPQPFLLTTTRPVERVLLCPIRRANPYLFLLDGLSILSSVNLVKPLSDIALRFKEYTDDGVHLRGHYGARLADQIPSALTMLAQNPTSRRVVMSIWRRHEDLGIESNDIPCNVMVIPRVINERLDLTVVNRSNDLFWGMLGANIVQFSFLQEYMAAALNLPVGSLYQFSTNLHAYTEFGPGKNLDKFQHSNPTFAYPPITPLDPENLCTDLDKMFLALAEDRSLPETQNTFLRGVVYPMIHSWWAQNTEPLVGLPDCDWFQAARMWWRA